MVRVCYVLRETVKISSKISVAFCMPTSMNESSYCLISSSAFGVVSVLDFGYSHRFVVISHCCFNFHFPGGIDTGASFHVFICPLYIFFNEVS